MIQIAKPVRRESRGEPEISTIADAARILETVRADLDGVIARYRSFWRWVEWLFSFVRTMREEDVEITEWCLKKLSLLHRHDIVQSGMLTAPEGTKLLIDQIQDLQRRLFVFRQRFRNTAL